MAKLIELDAVRREQIVNKEHVLKLDKRIRELMKTLEVSFVRIQIYDLQERVDFVAEEIFKRWPELKPAT